MATPAIVGVMLVTRASVVKVFAPNRSFVLPTNASHAAHSMQPMTPTIHDRSHASIKKPARMARSERAIARKTAISWVRPAAHHGPCCGPFWPQPGPKQHVPPRQVPKNPQSALVKQIQVWSDSLQYGWKRWLEQSESMQHSTHSLLQQTSRRPQSLTLQHPLSHSSGMPVPLPSWLVPLSISHGSGMLFPLQSGLVQVLPTP